jgi:hypothetical protein
MLPVPLRWLCVTLALAAGAALQSFCCLAAGTLAFATGVLLAVRGGRPAEDAPVPRAWRTQLPDDLEAMSRERRAPPSRWARLLDGTSLAGAPVALAAVAGAFLALRWLAGQMEAPLVDAAAIDLVLALAALFTTGRRLDLVPALGEGGLRTLARILAPLARVAKDASSEVRLLVGLAEDRKEVLDVRLVLVPPPAGTTCVEVCAIPRLGLAGFRVEPVACVRRSDGSTVHVGARGGRSLARRLGRALRRSREQLA